MSRCSLIRVKNCMFCRPPATCRSSQFNRPLTCKSIQPDSELAPSDTMWMSIRLSVSIGGPLGPPGVMH
ncbi:hypothetical protein [Lysobacter gummosus]|uniref:hypothetical protein n=1 Tax=Lysobacter gummosus TaxID=262324 RepID=UPI00362AAEA6